MFSSSPFGQSSSSPFGSPSVFGQTNNASTNPFAPNPFGSTTPFGAQTGGSIFGGTSTGVFGAKQSSSPLASTPGFGASSVPAFGASSVPAFGASSTPAFGASSTPAFGSSAFGQKPAFGGFGSNTAQTSPFGSAFQQSQPAFGSSLFGSSTPFGGQPSQSAFGATSSPAFGSTTTQTFGSTGTGFGVSSAPAFGSTAFGASSSPFGASSTPFGASSASPFVSPSTSAFGGSASTTFGTTSTPFNFASSTGFGQSTSAFASSPFGTSTSPFTAQSSPFGTQATTPTFAGSGFGQAAFGGQRGGSRVVSYAPTPEADSGSGTQPAAKLESISAMPAYKEKSHEELRWEDYQLGDKGGPAPAVQSAGAAGFGVSSIQTNPFASSSTFGQSSANLFSSATASNPFTSKPPGFGNTGFVSSSTAFGSSPFATSTPSSMFGSTSSSTTSLFGSTSGFGANTSSLFGSTSTSLFGSASAPSTTLSFSTGLSFANAQSSPLFQSNAPPLGQSSSIFGQTPSSFAQSNSAFGQPGLFSTPSTGFSGNMFSSTPSLTSSPLGFGQATPSLSAPFPPTQATQTSGAFNFNNISQTHSAGVTGFSGTPGIFGQSTFGQPSAAQGSLLVQPSVATNPFGTLPALPQMSIGRTGTSSSVQYGISSLPVVDKPAPVRISSLLTSRHLSQRRIRLPARKYNPRSDSPKVPFFSDDEETPSTPKADALFIPRENPRALVIRPLEQRPSRVSAEKASPSSSATHENGKTHEAASTPLFGSTIDATKYKDAVENGFPNERPHLVRQSQKPNGVHDDHSSQKADSYITLTGHRAGEAAIVYEHGADIEALMPKLRHSDYFTEPRIQELAAKERAEPGFCRRVKDFVVGRHGYGSIKFTGETDVRRLDLESLVQFNHREVIVYLDESKKPPVGQGLNKPAEVTLLNIKCLDKKTGQNITEGPRIEKYKEMLKKKAEDQGAEFVSYDPNKGEWKFRVSHFSRYRLGDEDEDENKGEDAADMHTAPS